MLAFANQAGQYRPSHYLNLVALPLTIIATAVAGWLLIKMLERSVPRLRRRLQIRIARRRRLHAAATAELSARAMMDEMCPHGWQAEIVLFGSADQLPDEAPDRARTRVQLDWSQLHESAAARRVWAPDVKQALEAMVAERITEETLQQIEQQALADGASWPDA
jgi:hypothetical protein